MPLSRRAAPSSMVMCASCPHACLRAAERGRQVGASRTHAGTDHRNSGRSRLCVPPADASGCLIPSHDARLGGGEGGVHCLQDGQRVHVGAQSNHRLAAAQRRHQAGSSHWEPGEVDAKTIRHQHSKSSKKAWATHGHAESCWRCHDRPCQQYRCRSTAAASVPMLLGALRTCRGCPIHQGCVE